MTDCTNAAMVTSTSAFNQYADVCVINRGREIAEMFRLELIKLFPILPVKD